MNLGLRWIFQEGKIWVPSKSVNSYLIEKLAIGNPPLENKLEKLVISYLQAAIYDQVLFEHNDLSAG